jgi:serine/arginine repetitive matrix protein 2
MAEAAEEKNTKMKDALGIKSDYKDGSSFNQELQAAQRASEKAKQEQEKLEREMEKEMEREKEKKKRLVF